MAKLADFKEREATLKECEARIQLSKEQLNKLKRKRHDEFMEGFKFIADRVKDMYRLITNGGDAELEVKDALDPFSEGILF